MTTQQLELRERLRKTPENALLMDGESTTQKQWDDYNEQFDAWFEKHKDNLTSMEAGMSKPNHPGYYRANND